MIDTKQIMLELHPWLNMWFKYEICYVNSLPDPLILVLDYSPQADSPPASFALSLSGHQGGRFPSKCWMTHTQIVPIGSEHNPPKPHPPYREFSYREYEFYPFSVELSGYTPRDADSIKLLIDRLYRHIKF